jgi:hypothetical protein
MLASISYVQLPSLSFTQQRICVLAISSVRQQCRQFFRLCVAAVTADWLPLQGTSGVDLFFVLQRC